MSTEKSNKYKMRRVADLLPYANNARTHSAEQINQVAASIEEFGFTNPILIDEECNIIAGHGRLAAALKLGMSMVPTVQLQGLSEAQKKAYVIADNQLALNAGWNLELLKVEIEDLVGMDFDTDLLGFDDEFFAEIMSNIGEEENPYSIKIDAPTYEPSEVKPDIGELVDFERTQELLQSIDDSDVPEDEKTFLRLAAERHTVFNFGKIADYYSNSAPGTQALMEQSALVIVDYKQAVSSGFANISAAYSEQCDDEYPE